METAFVAAGDAFSRFGLVMLLRTRLGATATFEVDNLAQLVALLANENAPEIVTVDPDLPGLAEFGGLRALRVRCPDLRIVAVGEGRTREAILHALESGMNGYVPHGLALEEMVRAFQQIAAGALYIPSMMTELSSTPAAVSTTGPASHAAADEGGALTERQRDVMNLLVAGKSNKEIGRTLQIAESTVKVHVTAAFRRLGVRSRLAAVVLSQRPRAPAIVAEPELPGFAAGGRRMADWGSSPRMHAVG